MKWIAVFVLLSLSSAAMAVHPSHKSIFSGDEPIHIEASNGIEWQSDTKQYSATGDAVATRGGLSIRADKLMATYRDGANGEPEIYQLQAEGAVRIEAGTDSAEADSAYYDLDKQYLKLSGSLITLVTSGQKITAAHSIEYWVEKRLAVATGRAAVYREGYRLTADTVRVTLAENADSGDVALATASAERNVVLYGDREEIRGSSAEYDAATQQARIKGSVELIRDDNKLIGSLAEVNLATGISRLVNTGSGDGRVKGVFRLDTRQGD